MRIVDLSETLDLEFVDQLLEPPSAETSVDESIAAIVDDVRQRGDAAVFEYTERFDNVGMDAERVRVGTDEIREYASGEDDDILVIKNVN